MLPPRIPLNTEELETAVLPHGPVFKRRKVALEGTSEGGYLFFLPISKPIHPKVLAETLKVPGLE